MEAFDAHGLRGQNDKLLDVSDMITGTIKIILGVVQNTYFKGIIYLITCY